MSSRVPMTLRSNFFADPFFQSTWDDFERLRHEMMRETMDFWNRGITSGSSSSTQQESIQQQQQQSSSSSSKMESSTSATTTGSSQQQQQQQQQQLARMDEDMFAPMFLFPRHWMLPRTLSRDESSSDSRAMDDFFSSKMRSLDLFQHKDEEVIRMKDDASKFELSLDTHDYRPDEIKVNVTGNVLSVEAKHEEKTENKFVSRQFSRKYTLPEGCEPAKVNSNLSGDGVLIITAPKKQAIKQDDNSRAVPIEMKK